MHLDRYFRPFLALPELLFVLFLLLVLSILNLFVPPQFHQSLGWTINLYQVFTVCTALAWFMLPGALLARILGVGGTWFTRLPTYFATAVGVWVIPSLWVAFHASFNVQYLMKLGWIMIAFLVVVAYLRELLRPSHPDAFFDEGRKDAGEPLNPLLLVLAVAAVIASVYLSFTAPVALDDNLQVMYVQDDLVVPKINQYEPVFGAGIPPQTRGSLTTWPLNLTVITYVTDLPAQQAFWLLRTPLVLLDLLAIYAIALQLFGKRNLALLCVIFYFILTLIYTTDADGIGFALYARGAQDKFVARYSIFPIALAWSMAYLKRPNFRAYWLAGVCTIGLSTTHPIGVILIGIPLGGVGIMHLFNHLSFGNLRGLRHPRQWVRDKFKYNWSVVKSLLFLSVFSLIGVIVPLLQQSSPDAPIVAYTLTDTRDPTLWFRINLAVNEHRLYIANFLGKGKYIVHPKVFMDAYILIPLIGLPILFIFWRKLWNSELIIGTFLLNPAILLIPPVVQFIGSKATPWLLYRFAWPLSLLGPLAICWAVWSLLELLGQKIPYPRVNTALPAFIIIITTVLLTQEITRGMTILSEQKSDTISALCRTQQPLFSQLPGLVGQGTVIISTPENDLCIPSSSAYGYPVEFGLTTTINRFPASRVNEAIQRMNDVLAFMNSDVIDQNLMNTLTRWNVGLILLRADHPLISQLQAMPQFFKLVLVKDRYMVFRVLPTAGTAILPDLPTKERWKVAQWEGNDPIVAANTSWTDEHYQDAITEYKSIAKKDGYSSLLDLLGLGRAQLSAGQLSNAGSTFLQATAKYPNSIQAWMLLGSTQQVQTDYPGMVHSYQQVLQMMDWHPQALTRLADAYRYLGQLDLARQYYERAIAVDNTPGTSIYYRTLGSMYLEVNWNDEAIKVLDKSIKIRDSLLAYSLLSQAYLNKNDLQLANLAAIHAKNLDHWSDTYSIINGEVDLANLNFADAVNNFKVAIRNNPQSTAIEYLTSILSSIQDHQAALDQITKLVGYKLGFAEPVLAAAQLQFSLGQLDTATTLTENAFTWKPVDSQAADFLGNINLTTGNWDQAHKYFKKALILSPSDQTAFSGLSSLAQLNGQIDTALGWEWSASIVSPHNSNSLIGVGSIAEIQGDTENALADYQLAIQTGPYNSQTYSSYGEFQSKQAQFSSAIQSFNQAIAVKPDDTTSYRGLSDANRALAMNAQALQSANRAVQLHPAEGANRVSVSQALAQGGDFSGAINALLQSISSDPGYPDAYLRLGSLYSSQGLTDQAEAIYKQMIQVLPYSSDGYLGLGKLYERQGKFNEAITTYQSALNQISPNISGNISLALADLLLRQGKTDQALQLYKKTISQQPMLAEGYSALSRYYISRGDYSSAKKILDQGLALLPASPGLITSLANLYISQGDSALAAKTYEQAMYIAPNSGLALSHAKLVALQGQPDLALAEIEAARQDWPGDTSILVNGSSLAISLGKPAEALQMANDLITIAPGFASSWTTLGEAYSAQAQFNQAELAFRKAVSVEPGNSSAELALGRFLYSRGDTNNAKQALAKAMDLDHTDFTPHLILAGIFLREANAQSAISELQAAANLDATQDIALLQIGQIRVQEGNLTDALNYFQKALTVSPMDPEAYQAQAQVYLVQGNTDKAGQLLLTATQAISGDCRSYIHLADYQSAHGEYTQALQSYQQALDRVGCTGSAHLGLGFIHEIQGYPDLAIAEYTQAMAVQPGNAQGYINAGRLFTQQAHLAEAEAAYQNGLAALPASAPLEIAYSNSLINRGKITEGLQAAQESVRLTPGAASYVALGNAFQASGQYAEARDNYNQASEANRFSSIPFLSLGDLSIRLGIFDLAQSEYQQAINIDPTNPQGYVSLGNLLLVHGQTDQAIQVLEQGISANHEQNTALMAEIRYYLQIGKFSEASDAIARAFASPSQDLLPYQDTNTTPANSSYAPELTGIWIAQGDLYRLQANWSAAEAAYQQAINIAPGFPNGYVALGKTYQTQGNYSEAHTQYSQAISIAPGSGFPYIALGDLLSLQANFSEAEQTYQQGIAAAPGQVAANIHLANLYSSQQNSSGANDMYNVATSLAPSEPSVWVALGDWYSAQAKPSQALQAYQHAIDVNSADPVGYVALGNFLQNTGNRGEALAQFQQAIQIAPNSKSGYLAIANWYLLEQNYTQAESYFNKAHAADSADIDGLLGLGYSYLAQKRSADAMTSFKTAQTYSPSDTRTYLAMGDWYRSNINTDASKQAADAILGDAKAQLKNADMRQPPSTFIEYVVAGIQDLQSGQIEQAYTYFEDAIAADPTSVLPYLAMGQWYRIVNGLTNAQQAYQSAIQLNPGDVHANLDLGQLYLSSRQSNLAQEQFNQAIKLAPGLALPHIYLGDWYQSQSNLQKAEAEYQIAINVEPGELRSYTKLADLYETEGKHAEAVAISEAALNAGVSNEVSVCAPGQLPAADSGTAIAVIYSSTAISSGSLYCQWDNRSWSKSTNVTPP